MVTLSGSPPRAWMLSWTQLRANVWSFSPRLPGSSESPVERYPTEAIILNYWSKNEKGVRISCSHVIILLQTDRISLSIALWEKWCVQLDLYNQRIPMFIMKSTDIHNLKTQSIDLLCEMHVVHISKLLVKYGVYLLYYAKAHCFQKWYKTSRIYSIDTFCESPVLDEHIHDCSRSTIFGRSRTNTHARMPTIKLYCPLTNRTQKMVMKRIFAV